MDPIVTRPADIDPVSERFFAVAPLEVIPTVKLFGNEVMKGERALLLTRRTHAFFGPTSCPALPLLVGFFRHRLFFPIPPPQWKSRCFLSQQRQGR